MSDAPAPIRPAPPRRSLLTGSAGLLGVQILSTGVLFALQVLLSHVMGDSYGVYAYVAAWVLVLSLLAKVGLETTLVRFVATYDQSGQDGLLRGVLRLATRLPLLLSIAVGVVVATVALLLGGRIDNELRMALIVGGVLLAPLVGRMDLLRAALQGLGRLLGGMSLRMLVQPLGLLALVGGFWLLGRRAFDAPFVLLLEAGVTVGAVLAGASLLRRAEGSRLDGPAEYETGIWLRAGAALVAFNAFFVVNTQADLIMLGSLSGTDAAGLYRPAVQVSRLLALVLTAVGAAAAPRMAALHAAGQTHALEKLLGWCLLGIAVLTIPAAIVLALLGPWVLSLFGPGFVAAYPALLVLLAGQTVNALFGPIGHLMAMTGRQNRAAWAMGIAAAINLALNAVLIPRLGLLGAAWATLVSTVLWNGLIFLSLRRAGIRVSPLAAFGATPVDADTRRPTFFLVGAPKCGTTAMAEYLAAHPQAFVSNPKEPGYYATDLPNLRVARDEATYLSLFAPAGADVRQLGEASVWYLYSESAVPGILADCPDAKFLVLLRNPLDLLPSLYEQFAFEFHENAPDFATAWAWQADRRDGRRIPFGVRRFGQAQLLQYADVARLGAQLERLIARVGRARVCAVLFDDLCADPRTEYLRVLAFLGLDDDGRVEFPVVNERKRHGRRGLAWCKWLVATCLARAKWRMGILSSAGIARRVAEAGTHKPEKVRLPESLRAQVVEALRDDVALLGRLLERDLSGWLDENDRD